MGEWTETTLGELCRSGGGDIQTGPFGSQLHAADYVPVGVPSVMPQNIGDNVIVENGIARIRQEDADRLSRYLLKPGDIVYSRRGDVERRALVRPEQAGWLCGTGCLRIRLGASADEQFVSYYLGDPDIRSWIVQHAIGATMPNLNTRILSALPVKLPTLVNQVSIAGILGALDDKIANNNSLLHRLKELLDCEFSLRMKGSQRSLKLAQVAELKYGRALPEVVRVPGDVPIYGGNGISGWHGRALVERPGIIIGRKGANAGSVSWSPVPFWAIDTAFYVETVNEDIPKEFLYFVFRNAGLRELVGDSAIPGLNRDIAYSVTLLLPEGRAIESFAHIARNSFALQVILGGESRLLAQLRDTLLPKLMSGQLRIKDAEKIVENAT